jgi:hypothetical protein
MCGPYSMKLSYPISTLLYSLVRISKEIFSYAKVILEAEVYTRITRFIFICKIDTYNHVAIPSFSMDRQCSRFNAI